MLQPLFILQVGIDCIRTDYICNITLNTTVFDTVYNVLVTTDIMTDCGYWCYIWFFMTSYQMYWEYEVEITWYYYP